MTFMFPYAPLPRATVDEDAAPLDVLVSTGSPVDADRIRRALAPLAADASVEIVLDRPPLHWARARATSSVPRARVSEALLAAGIAPRYVASAVRPSMILAPPLEPHPATPAGPGSGWSVRAARDPGDVPESPAHWFLRATGVALDRARCGTGAGTRLAVLDDDAADAEFLDLDATVLFGIDRAPCGSGHGMLMGAWAVGARRYDHGRYEGVAPDASPRLYLVPKPEVDVYSLPAAIASAALDGADVLLCATYLEGTTSPMLDEALAVAAWLGRGGRGAVVVMPTGRETSSAPGCVHASLSLSLADPACDPRVACIAPGGRTGGWFLFRGGDGTLRPFANRGPAVRWLAPGDDLVYPLLSRDRPFHAESSGACALAAGVALLVLGRSPDLDLGELATVLTRTAGVVDRAASVDASPLADPADVLPHAQDRDGHDAKHGYGRLDATRACLAASDPVALELLAMGEDVAALRWCDGPAPWSASLGAWMARALLGKAGLEHGLRVVLRHARLLAGAPAVEPLHERGAVARHVSLLLRELARLAPPVPLARELQDLERRARSACDPAHPDCAPFERALMTAACHLWRRLDTHSGEQPPTHPLAVNSPP